MNSSSRTPAPGSGSIAERAEPGVAAAVVAVVAVVAVAVAAAAAVLVVVAVAAVGFAAATATAAAVVASALLVVASFVFAVVGGAVARRRRVGCPPSLAVILMKAADLRFPSSWLAVTSAEAAVLPSTFQLLNHSTFL